MAKKRRHVSALRTSVVPSSRDTTIGLEKSLDKLETYYDQLSESVMEIPAKLDRILLIHNLVALVMQNGLLVIQGMSFAQMMLLVGSAVWMMRKSIGAILLPYASFIKKNATIYRMIALFLMLAIFKAIDNLMEMALSTMELVQFGIICQLDVASIYFDTDRDTRRSWKPIVVAALETIVLVAGFSSNPLHTHAIIIDTTAFMLTTLTACVHTVVSCTAKYVVLNGFGWDVNGTFARTQQRGAELIERLWQDIDCFEPEELLAVFVGAPKAKNKSRTRLRTMNKNVDLNQTLHTQQHSILNEPSMQLATLILIQILLLLLQMLLSAFVVYSWEMISVLMLSSSHVLWTLGQIRRHVLSRRKIRPTDFKLQTP